MNAIAFCLDLILASLLLAPACWSVMSRHPPTSATAKQRRAAARSGTRPSCRCANGFPRRAPRVSPWPARPSPGQLQASKEARLRVFERMNGI